MRSSKRLFLAVTVVVLAVGVPWAQTTYYVDPAGSDDNAGTSPGSAWRSVAKVNTTRLMPGDVVLFRRGGIWRESLEPSSSASGGARIVFGAYGSGARPVITQRGDLGIWRDAGGWINRGGNLWTRSCPTVITRIFLDGVESGAAASQGEVSSRYRFYSDGSTITLFAVGNPASAYRSIEIPQGQRMNYAVLRIHGKSYLTFTNLAFEGGENTIECDDGDYLLFDNCDVGAWAGTYGARFLTNSDHGEVRNCTFDSRDTIQHTFSQNGGDLLALVDANDWNIHHNRFLNFAHGGVGMSPASSPNGTSVSRNRVHHNEFSNRGDFGRAWGCQGGTTEADACRDNEFFSNWVHGVPSTIQLAGKNNRCSYNLIDTVRLPPWSVNAASPGAGGFHVTASRAADSIFIDNNVIRNTDGPGILVEGGAGRVFIRNNIIYNTGLRGDYNTDGMVAGGEHVALWLAKDDWPGTRLVREAVVQNNCFFSTFTKNTVVVDQWRWSTTVKIPVDQLNARNGENGNRISGNLGADPLLDASLRLRPGSPCIDAGLSIGLAVDFWGTPVSPPGKPDIGASEANPASRP